MESGSLDEDGYIEGGDRTDCSVWLNGPGQMVNPDRMWQPDRVDEDPD